MLKPKSPQASFYGNYTSSTVWYGDCRNSQGDLGTDKLFTGQRLDDTGLYYYGARYYDPAIGRFISSDTIVQNPANPQTLNRYSYCLNNPLKYIDPSGHDVHIGSTDVSDLKDILDQINEANEWAFGPSAALMAAFWDAYNGLGENWVDLFDAWERLAKDEPAYTQHMEESVIIFNVVDIYLPEKTVSFNVDMPLISFDEPVQLVFVSGNQMADVMFMAGGLPLRPAGVSLYPEPVYIRTDIARGSKSFTDLVAEELYHRWEQSLDVVSWYRTYYGEIKNYPFAHDKRPSEIRADKYVRYARGHYRP
jgi:RHS repeat-associated protein